MKPLNYQRQSRYIIGMTGGNWLATAQKELTDVGIETSRLDVLVLMEHVLGIDRARLLAHPEMELLSGQENVLKQLIGRRAGHEPLAYVLSKSEFYGRDFAVSSAVLVPRPESETMIDLLKQLLADHDFVATLPRLANSAFWHLADVGTGSGALGITAVLELPNTIAELLEIDDAAIEIAKMNVVKHTTAITVTKSDLLANLTAQPEILLCNLPYVPDDYPINQAAQYEPTLALFGGPDGLDLYRRLFEQIKNLTYQPLLILCESFPAQHGELTALAADSGYWQHLEDDFIQAFTVAA